MSQYHIHIDPKLPDSDKIRQYKNFETVYTQYQAAHRLSFWRNLYRNPRYFAALVAVGAVGWLVYEASLEPPQAQLPQAAATPAVFPARLPDPQLTSLTDTRWVDITPGLQLQATPDAFGIQPGTPFQLEVVWTQAPAAQYLTGLPLQHVIADAGILRVQARLGDSLLPLRPGQFLTLRRTAPADAPVLNLLRLEHDSLWVNLAQDISRNCPEPDQPAAPPHTAESPAPEVVPPPARPFGVQVRNAADFPEFAGYARVYWAWVPGPGSADPWQEGLIGDKSWEQVRVRRKGDLFELMFTRQAGAGVEIKRVLARPLFEARTEAEANQLYQAQLRDWERAASSRVAAQAPKPAPAPTPAPAATCTERYLIRSSNWHLLGQATDAPPALATGLIRMYEPATRRWTPLSTVPDSVGPGQIVLSPGLDGFIQISTQHQHNRVSPDSLAAWLALVRLQ
ncbi:MAG: hypothetical protein SF053_05410 [Bacteroidia bacterium]|nr:hypothetical protein [Bacteroidia bacterium]